MKIAFIVQWFPALSESFILSQIAHMIDRGHTVEIISQYRTHETLLHPSITQYDLLSKTAFAFSIPRNKILRRLKAVALSAACFFASPRRTVRLLRACWHGGNRFDFPSLFLGLKCIGKSFDVLCAHFGPSGNSGLALKRIGIAPKLIAAFHGYDIRMALAGDRNLYRELFGGADRLLANSQYTQDRLLELGADPSIVQVHPMGIDLAQFPLRDRSIRPQDRELLILTVGRYVPEKGLEFGIRAFARLASRFSHQKARYEIIGFGPEEDKLGRLIRELRLQEVVFLAGPKNHTEVIERLYQADLFLLPSVSEALGVVLLEAQAAGLPIVATETDGIPFAVIPGKSALLVPPADADALADKLCWLIDNPRTWPDMIKAGREHVEAYFNIRKLNEALESLCFQLCQGAKIENRKSAIETD
ncbi:MAG: colanic acid biosynthesis glycosyltransferase WcaL [Phycisphaerae bacterium]|nr:colanic acid biosynthesis glycosyltransferase WcaL [Phycisphaerae bacterium]